MCLSGVGPVLGETGTVVAPSSTQRLPSVFTRRLAALLLARLPDLAAVLRDRLLTKDEVYASTDLVAPEELFRSCHDNVLRSLQALSGEVPDGVDLMDAAQLTAARRADAGFPLESLLHAYRLGTEVLWEALLEEARAESPELLDELLDSAMQVMRLMDTMSMAAVQEYRTRQTEVQRRDAERRQEILDRLLEGRGADPDVAAEAESVLGLGTDDGLAVVVVRYAAPSTSPPRSPRDSLAVHGFRSEWRLRGDREIGLVQLGSAPVERLADRLPSVLSGPAALSPRAVGPREVVTAYRMAELALSTIPVGRQMIATLDDRLPEAMLAASPLVADRITSCALGELRDQDTERREQLLETLASWFRHNRSSGDVGAELHCHRNTVLHRLGRIEQLTGRRLDDPRDELLLRLALLT